MNKSDAIIIFFIIFLGLCLGRLYYEKSLKIEEMTNKKSDVSALRIEHLGYITNGTLVIENTREKELRNVLLEIRLDKELSPAQIDFLSKSGKEIKIIEEALIQPNKIFIESIKPKEVKNYTISVVPKDEGNYVGIGVYYQNVKIFGFGGFI